MATTTKLSVGYTADIKDDGVTLAYDCDWILDVTVTLSGGAPEIEVVGVYVDGGPSINLMVHPSSKTSHIAHDIAGEAEADEWFIEKVLDEAGLSYHGRGGNDPDGYYTFRREREEA